MARLVLAAVVGFVVLVPVIVWLSWALKDHLVLVQLLAIAISGGVVALTLSALEKKRAPDQLSAIPPRNDSPASPEDQVFRAVLESLRQPRTKRTNVTTWLTLSLLVFVALGMTSGQQSLATVGAIAVVLLLHELGHAAAMRAFGYADVKVFFIPFLGAATTGSKASAPLWQQCVVFLAGPVPGLVLGVMIHFFVSPHDGTWLGTLSGMLIALNAFNLLPVEPLDGGRIAGLLVLGGVPRVRAVVSVITALLCWALLRLPPLFAAPIFVGVVLAQVARWRAASAAARLRMQSRYVWEELPRDPSLAEDEVLFCLYSECRRGAQPGCETDQQYRSRVRQIAGLMRTTYELLQFRAAPAKVAISAGLVFVAMLVLLAFTVMSGRSARAEAQGNANPQQAVRHLDDAVEMQCVSGCLALDQDPQCKNVCRCQVQAIQQRTTPEQRRQELQKQTPSKEYLAIVQETAASCSADLFDRRFVRNCATQCQPASGNCIARCQCILERLRGDADRNSSTLWLMRAMTVPPTQAGQARMQEALLQCTGH